MRSSPVAGRGKTSRWLATSYSARLSRRRNRDTAPELLLRRRLFAAGLRFRVHRRLFERVTIDIVMPGLRLGICVDGCFWHSCPRHGRASFSGPNADLWMNKLARNIARDQRVVETASRLGWTVLRVWECDVIDGSDRLAQAIARVSRQYRASTSRLDSRTARHS